VSLFQKGQQILVSEQYKVEIQIGSYKDEFWCDVMPMDVYHNFWGDHGNMKGKDCMMGEIIDTPLRTMGTNMCFYH